MIRLFHKTIAPLIAARQQMVLSTCIIIAAASAHKILTGKAVVSADPYRLFTL